MHCWGQVRDGEDFPADLVCLHCASEQVVCYVKTTNLDGAVLSSRVTLRKCLPGPHSTAYACMSHDMNHLLTVPK